MLNTSCSVWNHCIALQRRFYSLYGKYISTNTLQKHIAKLRKKNTEWSQLNSQTVQEICQRVDIAYQRFFKGTSTRPPKFKKYRDFSSFVLKQSGWKVKDNVLTIGKHNFKFSKSREYANIKRISVKRNKLGEIFFVLTCDVESKKFERLDNANIGIDFGLKMFLTCSNEEEIKSPEFFKQNIKKLKKLSHSFSKKVKGSSNRKRALSNLQRLHIDIVNKRDDFHWKLAHTLCSRNSFIAIEDLDIKSMQSRFGRKINDLAFSSFVEKLEKVSKKYGTTLQRVGRYFPSSKLCSCGHINDKLSLKDREWVCEKCGSLHKRDLLASKNILSEGIRLYSNRGKTSSEALGVKSRISRL